MAETAARPNAQTVLNQTKTAMGAVVGSAMSGALNGGETVAHLDTKSFEDAITAFSSYITSFETIVKEVRALQKKLLDNWKGEGSKAYDKDCCQVFLNLQDLSDIMYELRDGLINAQVEYIRTDAAVSKGFDS